jgi:hypothetical protein
MSETGPIVPLLIFEAADCLMAVPASEIALPEKMGGDSRPLFDLSEYFTGHESEGPWLRWTRGTRSAWLRVLRVIDVVPVALSGLTPMPVLLRGQRRTRAFLASGVHGSEVFLLLDPARLGADALKAGLKDSSDSSRLPDSSRRGASS